MVLAVVIVFTVVVVVIVVVMWIVVVIVVVVSCNVVVFSCCWHWQVFLTRLVGRRISRPSLASGVVLRCCHVPLTVMVERWVS